MIIVDYYSRYYEYVVMTSTTSEKVIDNVEDNFSHHGLPLTLTSDNETPFSSNECQEYCKQNGIVPLETLQGCH